MTSDLLTLQNVTLSFSRNVLIDNLSTAVKASEVVWLQGPNGSGKTTLLRYIAGFFQGSGDVHYDKAQSMVLDHVLALDHDLTVRDHLTLWSSLYQTSLSAFIDVLTFWTLGDMLSASVKHLSKGQQQKLALVRTLTPKRSLFLLDEPTTNLDAQTQIYVWKMLRVKAESGAGVLVASHDTPGYYTRTITLERSQS